MRDRSVDVFVVESAVKAGYLANVCPRRNADQYTVGEIFGLILKLVFGLKIYQKPVITRVCEVPLV